MAVNINVPSQVKTYANLAAFPATGALKTIYIAEDNNKTYRWTGSVYVEISASAAAVWGNITGTLSNQTDLQNALNAKENTITAGTTSQYFRGDKTFQTLDKAAVGLGNVDNTSDASKPISTATQTALNAKQNTLTLTTTGTSGAATLVGSTLNIPQYSGGASGITIGTTAITSGTVGRILFEGTGNVVQESGNLFWDNTNGRLGIGTSSPTSALHVFGNGTGGAGTILAGFGIYTRYLFNASATATCIEFQPSTHQINFTINGTEAARLTTTRNLLIGTTTDAGFRLDVNGTARVQGNFTASGAIFTTAIYPLNTNETIDIWNRRTTTNGSGILIRDAASVTGNSVNINVLSLSGAWQTIGTSVLNNLLINREINLASGTQTVRGIYYNPTLTNTTGLTTHYAIHTAVGRIRFENLPTSSAGLSSGELWNNLGVLMIV